MTHWFILAWVTAQGMLAEPPKILAQPFPDRASCKTVAAATAAEALRGGDEGVELHYRCFGVAHDEIVGGVEGFDG